jgi:hypothetical protein
MTTETGAVAGIATAPQDQSQGVRLVRTIGPTQGRPLARGIHIAAGARIATRLPSLLLAAVAVFFKMGRRAKEQKVVALELDDRDVVLSSVPPPLPSEKVLTPKLVEPDVKAFFTRRF